MSGFFRKIIIETGISETGTGRCRAALEDDFHNFRVEVTVQDGFVASTATDPIRFPYTTCPAAGDALLALVGKSVTPIAHQVFRITDARLQCTHMLDLSGLAIAALVRGVSRVEYDVHVTDRIDGNYEVHLARDGRSVFSWHVVNDTIDTPGLYKGQHLKTGFASWALTHLDPTLSEAALVARRCAMISIGREKDLDSALHAQPTDHCYSQQTERYRDALRINGSTLDFSNSANTLCADDRAWVSGNAAH
jgi:hypothetical protein